MRPVTINPNNVAESLREIERASHEADVTEIAQARTVTGAYTPTRTLDASSATLADLRAFVATLVADLQKGGENRTT